MRVEETKILVGLNIGRIVLLVILTIAIIASIVVLIVLLIKRNKEKNVIRQVADPFEEFKTEMYSPGGASYNYGNGGTTVQLFNEIRKVKLTLTDVNMPAKRYTAFINNKIVIGRSATKADICIDYDPFISGTHCAIEMRNGRFYLIDLQSSNKTYMNNKQVLSEVEISSGCIISMGRVSLRVEMSIV